MRVLQVDFLNSVIIDLQKKNDELQQRLDIMETGGQLMNGASDSLELRWAYGDWRNLVELEDLDGASNL